MTKKVTKKIEEKKEDGNIDVLFTFDTTGSMYPCLSQVRNVIAETVKRLFNDIKDLRIGFIAHGDYCDRGRPYVTKIMDFSRDEKALTNFVQTVQPTGGGDAPECYELVLRQARTDLNWKSGRAKIVVMIGDDVPHGPDYYDNKDHIDWRNELGLLLEAGINVYGVHAMPGIRTHSRPFYKEIAKKTGGFYLTLNQFSDVVGLIMSVCYKQDGTMDQFKSSMEKEGKMTPGMIIIIDRMEHPEKFKDEKEEEFRYYDDHDYRTRRTPAKKEPKELTEKFSDKGNRLIRVPEGRFQTMEVPCDISIKDFVQDQGIEFEPGRGFYELTKTVEVQQYKDIVLMEKKTGDFFHGAKVRKMLGLSPQIDGGKGDGVKENLRPTEFKQYKVFIQSTSYNRKLLKGTGFLYEVIDK